MGCATFNSKDGIGFICGPGINPRPKRCAFCGEAATKLCDWPIERKKNVIAGMLKAGDRIYPFSTDKGPPYLILAVSERSIDGRIEVVWEWKGKPQMPYLMRVTGKVRLIVPGTCDKACCHRHRRHVGPDRDYCQEHWRQEEIS